MRDSPGDSFQHPERIGPYKILQVIGEGGMGYVYEAEQTEPVRRRVALKVIKTGMDTRQVVARFEAERQALAVMAHPNIAKVLDAGATDDGRPFFVMELVRGLPVNEYCDVHKLSVSQRLQLFVLVCQAVQHAHQKGVIHRDLKPSNVMVAEEGGVAEPKVIDFGIAKATGQQLTEKTLVTEHGQAIGTPAYMSPEQAERSGLDVDTRTDIYSLGVMLYELLVGRLPLDPSDLGVHAFMAQLVMRETDPPTPSARLSSLGDAQKRIADHRHVDPSALRRELKGDLDWITMKAMEKDRTRRYESANGLALDIQRFLKNEPVLARPPSAQYRFGKFVRRHRAVVFAGSIVAFGLVAGAVMATVGMVRATRAEALAAREAAAAQQVADFLVSIFEVSDPGETQGNSITARELLDAGAARIETELADQPVVQARLMSTIGYVYYQLGLYNRAASLLEEARIVSERELAPDDLAVANVLNQLAILYRDQGRQVEAEDLFLRALAIREGAEGLGGPDIASTLTNLGSLYAEQGRYEEAEALLRRAVEIDSTAFGPTDPRTMANISNLAVNLWYQGRLDEAEPLFRRVLEIEEETKGPDHPDVGESLNNLGALYWMMERYADAEPLYERAYSIFENALGPDHPYTAAVLNNLGETFWIQGKYADAERMYLRSLTIKQEQQPGHPTVATTLYNLGNLYRDMESYDVAEDYYNRALEIRERELGPESSGVAEVLEAYAAMLRAANRDGEAERLEARALAIRGDGP
jgi:serine/threonine protein kinase/Tfp pilus assembly protein PilF